MKKTAELICAALIGLLVWGSRASAEMNEYGVDVPSGDALSGKPAEAAPSGWAKADVNFLIQTGIVPVRLQGDYQERITREEYSELVVNVADRLSGHHANLNKLIAEKRFTDTDSIPVYKALALGIVNGVSDTEFLPHERINRQEAAVMMANLLKSIHYKDLSHDEFSFVDKLAIEDWAKDSVNITANAGIFEGTENGFRAYDSYTREQAIVTMKRLVDLIDHIEGISIRGKVYIPLSDIDPYSGNMPAAPVDSDMKARMGIDYIKIGLKENEGSLSDYWSRISPNFSVDTTAKLLAGAQMVMDGGLTIETGQKDCLLKISW